MPAIPLALSRPLLSASSMKIKNIFPKEARLIGFLRAPFVSYPKIYPNVYFYDTNKPLE